MPNSTPGIAATMLRAGQLVTDRVFDRVFPTSIRLASHEYWTPVKVASRAARLLANIGAERILDVGAGPGKFCIVGALTTSAQFTGIEQRENLVHVARMAAWRLGADRVRFLHRNLVDFDFNLFDAFYLYNPFYEQLGTTALAIDDQIARSPSFYRRYVVTTTQKLARARIGTAVITYHGFGGVMPAGYRRVHQEPAGEDHLVLWVKTHRRKRSKAPTARPGRTPR
jgi:hypothetical protein